MVKASRPPAVKTLTIVKSRDIIVDKLLKPCEVGNHPKCTGWAVLKREISPINANYFLKCTCTCHKKKAVGTKRNIMQRKKPQIKRKTMKKQIRKKSTKKKKSRRGKRTRR